MLLRSLLVTWIMAGFGSWANAQDRTLFTFDNPEQAAKPWRVVDDGVMGGLSKGQFRITDDGKLEFFGTLSLENNGGFSSIRAQANHLAMVEDDVIVARVRGDGREYRINVYTQPNLGGYSYRQYFKTQKDAWIEVELPVKKLVASYRGRVFPNEKLDPTQVAGFGFLLGDKKPGSFKLEVDWVKVRSAQQ